MLEQTPQQRKATANLEYEPDFVAFKEWLQNSLSEEDRMNRRTPAVHNGQGRAQILEEIIEAIGTACSKKP